VLRSAIGVELIVKARDDLKFLQILLNACSFIELPCQFPGFLQFLELALPRTSSS
jgi:hypothetical protein